MISETVPQIAELAHERLPDTVIVKYSVVTNGPRPGGVVGLEEVIRGTRYATKHKILADERVSMEVGAVVDQIVAEWLNFRRRAKLAYAQRDLRDGRDFEALRNHP